jgi:isoaspartyl peptidase/L-asparaginase-like protein (Ntn-hydrolase superfamily)
MLTERTGGKGGLLIVDRRGRIGFAFTTSRMALAYRTSDSQEPVVRL